MCEQPSDIRCTVVDTGLEYDTTINVLNSECTVQNGLECLADDQVAQTLLVNTTYNFTDQRLVETTEFVYITQLQCQTYENATDLTECNATDTCNSSLVAVCINGTVSCVNETTLSGENATICSNVTEETSQSAYMNETFVNTSWHMKNTTITPPCEDYQISLLCQRGEFILFLNISCLVIYFLTDLSPLAITNDENEDTRLLSNQHFSYLTHYLTTFSVSPNFSREITFSMFALN